MAPALRPLNATHTRVGNSIGGLSPRGLTFPDGSPVRAAVPATVARVGVERDGKIRLVSEWNEGGGHTVWVTPGGEQAGHAFDFPFEAPPFAVGLAPGDTDADREWHQTEEVPQGAVLRGVRGVAWEQTPWGRFTLTTPEATLHSTVQTDCVVPDPKDPTLLYDANTRYKMRWAERGDGREWHFAGDTIAPALYPTDPRLHVHAIGQGSHRTTFRAFRAGGETYLASGANEVDFHRWDALTNLWVPAASVMVRPPRSDNATPGWPPEAPEVAWGQGLLWRDADGDGHMEAGEYELTDLPAPLWNEFDAQVGPYGSVTWRGYGSDAAKGCYELWPLEGGEWDHFDYPASLLDCDCVEMTRHHFDDGTFYAVRRQGDGWELSAHKRGPDYAIWRTPLPWVKGVRRGTATHELPNFAPGELVGALAVEGDFVFLAHGQGGGVDVFRRDTGEPVGRMATDLAPNSTLDEPRGGFHVWRRGGGRGAEYVCSLMDFNGSAALLWRVPEAELSR
jgi:hypothetical protein